MILVMSILNSLPPPSVPNNHDHVCHPQRDYASPLCPVVVGTLTTSISTTTSNSESESVLPVGAGTVRSQPISVPGLCILPATSSTRSCADGRHVDYPSMTAYTCKLTKLFSNITQTIQVTVGEPIVKLCLSASPPTNLLVMMTTISIMMVPSQPHRPRLGSSFSNQLWVVGYTLV